MQKNTSGYEPEKNLGYVLWQLTHRMYQMMIEELKDLDLVPAQVGALAHVARNETVSNADLARSLLMTPQNMSLTTAKLEESGYLRKTAHERHGRIMVLEITQKGSEALAEAAKRMKRVEQRMMTDLNRNEQKDFARMAQHALNMLLRNAGKKRKP